MPSPFPGMDPYFEDHTWADFHSSLAYTLRAQISKKLPPELIVNLETTVLTESVIYTPKNYRPDIAINTQGDGTGNPSLVEDPVASYGVQTPPTMVFSVEFNVEIHQKTIEVRRVDGGQLVAAIEILSPTNKKEPNLTAYRNKRLEFLENGIHLLEIDLLRYGTRPDWFSDCPESTYGVQLIDVNNGITSVWALDLSTPLPVVPLPLLKSMSSIVVDLPKAFDKMYDECNFEKSLNYTRPLAKRLRRGVDQKFIRTLKLPYLKK